MYRNQKTWHVHGMYAYGYVTFGAFNSFYFLQYATCEHRILPVWCKNINLKKKILIKNGCALFECCSKSILIGPYVYEKF